MTDPLTHVSLMAMRKILRQGIEDLCYPPNCLLCRRYVPEENKAFHLCPECISTITLNIPPFCAKCSRHLSDPSQFFCVECSNKKFDFDQALAPCFYNETLRKLIHLFKYGNKTLLRHYFSQLILSFLENYFKIFSSSDLIIPVPLHPVRFRERGYNQTQLLAQKISQVLRIPLSVQNLIRIRYTQNQARIPPKNRFTNIQGAFRIKNPNEIKEKEIVLVDDLLTSGTTVHEASHVLKEAGARKVIVLTLALAP